MVAISTQFWQGHIASWQMTWSGVRVGASHHMWNQEADSWEGPSFYNNPLSRTLLMPSQRSVPNRPEDLRLGPASQRHH
jgi:hypothetical protein